MGSDDGGDGGNDPGMFRGRLGLNARYVTLVAVGAGGARRPARDERALILALFAADRPSEGHKKRPLSRVRAAQSPELLPLAASVLPRRRRFARRTCPQSLKNPLHPAQYLPGENVAARLQRDRNGTVSLRV